MNKRYLFYEYQQLKALSAILNNTNEYFERKVRRWYSKEFHTPLIEVYKLGWDHVLLNYYESKFESLSHNDLVHLAQTEYLSTIKDSIERENQEFTDSLIKEQETQLKAKQLHKPKPKEFDLNFTDKHGDPDIDK